MGRHNIPARVTVLLGCISPLTPKQVARALNYKYSDIGTSLAAMHAQGRLRRTQALTGRQQLVSHKNSHAYMLEVSQ